MLGCIYEARARIGNVIIAFHHDSGRHIYKAAPSATLTSGLSSLAQYEGPVFNQIGGSCEAHRAAQGLFVRKASKGVPITMPSPDDLYRNARVLGRWGNPTDPLTDSGVQTSTMVQCLATYGCRPIGANAIPGAAYTDMTPDTINAEPSFTQMAEDATTLTTGEYAIDIADPTGALANCQAAIRIGVPVWADIFVDTAMMNWKGGAPLDVVNMGDTAGGYHAVLLDEMLVTSAGVTLSILNSWGPGWGVAPLDTSAPNKGGHLLATGNWFAKAVVGLTIGEIT